MWSCCVGSERFWRPSWALLSGKKTKEQQEAERKRVEAQGIADYQRIINTGLTANQLQYEQIKAMKEIAISQNSKVIIMGAKTPVILNSKE